MKISTKKGDKGETYLAPGKKVSKASDVVMTMGTVDELSCNIGEARSLNKNNFTEKILHKIQQDLFKIGAELSSKKKVLNKKDIEFLEAGIEILEKKLPELKNFILPSGTVAASKLHVCRAVCRRAERLVVKLNIQSEIFIPYLNRLSDLLFLLARYSNFEKKKKDEIIKIES